MTQFDGSGQTGAPNTRAAQPLNVYASDIDTAGGPTATFPISWNVISGTATFVENGAGAYTGSSHNNSVSSVNIQFGSTPGTVVVEAVANNAMCAQSRVQYILTITGPSSPPPPPQTGPAQLLVIAGDAQSGATGATANAPLQVKLVDGNGSPIAGQPVVWQAITGMPILTGASGSTDAAGLASVSFRYPAAPGAITIRATASINGTALNADFHATAFSPVATVASGDHQTAAAGSALGAPLVVQLTAPTGASSSLNQVMVIWSVIDGGGTLGATTTLTDATGHTSNTFHLGPSAGISHIQATLPGGISLVFTATATAPVVTVPDNSQFQIVAGNGQNLIPNQASQPLVVRLQDSLGHGIADATVLWSAGSEGTLDAATTTTDSAGLAHNRFTVNRPGDYSVTASVAHSSLPSVTFTFANGLANLGLTDRQHAIARAIDRICSSLAGMSAAQLSVQQTDLLRRCNELLMTAGPRPQQVPGVIDRLLNDAVKPQASTAQNSQMLQFNNLSNRLIELRNGAHGFSVSGLSLQSGDGVLPLSMLGDAFRKDPASTDNSEIGKDFSRWGFFATGTFGQGSFDPTRNRPGFDFDSGNLTAGLDYRFSDALVGGMAFSYNRNHSSLNNGALNANDSKTNSDGYSLSGYATWYGKNDFYLDAVGTLGWINYDLARSIVYQLTALDGSLISVNQTATASPNGKQGSLSLAFGKDFSHEAWVFGPYLRGVYSRLNLDAFSESMSDPTGTGSGLGMQVDERRIYSETGIIGGKLSYTFSRSFGVLTPNATLEWNHEFRDDPQTVVTHFVNDPTFTPIVITDQRQDDSYFNLGLGLSAVFPQGRSGYVYFEHIAGLRGVHENRLALGLRIEF